MLIYFDALHPGTDGKEAKIVRGRGRPSIYAMEEGEGTGESEDGVSQKQEETDEKKKKTMEEDENKEEEVGNSKLIQCILCRSYLPFLEFLKPFCISQTVSTNL